MKKIILSIGLLSFLYGGYYIRQNYTFIQLNEAQLVQVGSSALQSSLLTTTADTTPQYRSDVLFRVGSFAVVKNSSQLLSE